MLYVMHVEVQVKTTALAWLRYLQAVSRSAPQLLRNHGILCCTAMKLPQVTRLIPQTIEVVAMDERHETRSSVPI